MAFYNKMATLLRQTVSAKNAQISGGSMFNTIRCISYAKLFDAKSKGLKSSKIFNAKAKGLTRLNRFNSGSKGITSAKARAKGITGHGLLQLLEMRLDNTLVRMGMASTVATARQLVSHGHVLVNGVGSKPSYHCKPGDIITAKDAEKFTALMQNSPAIGKLRSSIREQNLGTAKYVIGRLRTSIEQEDIETAKRLGTTKVCEGSSFAEHTRIKRSLYRFKSLFSSKRRNEKNQYVPPRTVSSIVNNFVFHRSKYCSIVSPALKPRRRKIKRISLPTHHLEVNYKTREAVVCYAPNVNHIPHGLSAKRLNVLL